MKFSLDPGDATRNMNSDYSNFYFLLVHPVNKNKLINRHSVFTCREFFTLGYRKLILSNEKTPYANKAYALVSPGMKTLKNQNTGYSASPKAIENWLKTFDLKMKRSLHIVNTMEKYHGWPMTRMFSVNSGESSDSSECSHYGITYKTNFKYFIGSKRWALSPYLFSLWTLYIRMGWSSWLSKKNVLKMNHDELIGAVLGKASQSGTSDSAQAGRTVQDWDFIMSSWKQLFPTDKSRVHHWSKVPLNGNDPRPEGVFKLVIGATKHTKLLKHYNVVRKKYIKKKEKEAKKNGK